MRIVVFRKDEMLNWIKIEWYQSGVFDKKNVLNQ